MHVLWIALGGAVGTVLRYGVSGWAQRVGGDGFPTGTLAVNVSGAFAVGFLATFLVERHRPVRRGAGGGADRPAGWVHDLLHLQRRDARPHGRGRMGLRCGQRVRLRGERPRRRLAGAHAGAGIGSATDGGGERGGTGARLRGRARPLTHRSARALAAWRPPAGWCGSAGSPTWTRTTNLPVNSRSLYQLSYRGTPLPVCRPSRGAARVASALASAMRLAGDRRRAARLRDRGCRGRNRTSTRTRSKRV